MTKKLLVLILGIFLFAFQAHAATFSLKTTPTSPYIVTLLLNTEGKDANAVQGTISYPTDSFSLKEVSDGNSIINFWLDHPREISSGTITFSGVTPGGYIGDEGLIVSLVFEPKKIGVASITLSNTSVLKNDGTGASLPVTNNNLNLAITNITTMPLQGGGQVMPPEPFTPTIAKDPRVFNGAYFLVFSTTDKGPGIDHYEVLEVPAGKSDMAVGWQIAESPYLLKDQSLMSDIYVRVIDTKGNFIVVKVPARSSKIIATFFVWTLILIGLFGVLLLGIWRYVHKFRRFQDGS